MISFIIPTLNEEKTIEKTLKCISEYLGEKEIIVSDGNSTDRTIEIVKKYTDKVIVYKGSKRQTIAQGRNDGAKIAQGEFVVFMDADVTIADINFFMNKMLNNFTNKKILATTTIYRVEKDLEGFLDMIIFTTLGYWFSVLNNLFRFGASGGEFLMVRKEAFVKIGGFNENLAAAEDMDLMWRLNKIGRTYSDISLNIFHSGRRAHKVGWPKLLFQWTSNCVGAFLFKKPMSKEWKEIR
ncbi:glycosyltransferase [Candidatus Nomurabacteria bacterium]|nr:glycosyltransferase [Candidatus Nomurabacteria bacterium]